MRYRKKPVIVEAFLTGSADAPAWMLGALDSGTAFYDSVGKLTIRTLEGDHVANPGDWIIRDIKGELYPCNPDIFAATYEPVPCVEGRAVRVSDGMAQGIADGHLEVLSGGGNATVKNIALDLLDARRELAEAQRQIRRLLHLVRGLADLPPDAELDAAAAAHDERIYRAGQKTMRERAADLADDESHRPGSQGYSGDPKHGEFRRFADQIRALEPEPIKEVKP